MKQFFWEKRLGGTPKQEIYTADADGYAILPDGTIVMVQQGKARRLTESEIQNVANGNVMLLIAERLGSQG